ncbi:imidazoleglycerol-phosphate dehydratase HisB [Campylobacter sp.]|uniref:imidazoleglycerol-phosphate dehydratase HisB n=1 Tax=Campylobacter sp. TaxID=205 RepID=UPI0027026FD6|nr:imidazoleglycerol-phosphate dehydratase HisB [Campylobacter sp.]
MQKVRNTKETQIALDLEIYGSGKCEINTGIGFFDHMLEAFGKHALFDLKIVAKGDLHIDFHHTVEDVGIVIGSALKEIIYPVSGIERFGEAIVVMDEAAVSCALDLSNRPFLVYDSICKGKVGNFDVELVNEFFQALAFNANITLHIAKIRGKNSHHIIEASFKALAVALRRALAKNERIGIPSTKGVL